MTTLKPFGSPAGPLRLSLADQSARVARALVSAFSEVAAVEVLHGNLLDVPADAVVSPANSFGDMSGGVDKVIDDFYRNEAQRRAVEAIASAWCGELPVGAALVVPLPGPRFAHLIVAPTMRIPGSIAGTINAYLAMRAILVTVLRHNSSGAAPIRTVAVPGLGTGVGGLHPDDAAEQMRRAFDSVVGEQWRRVVHPALAPFALRRGST
jgi:O-acetyl-ADP-ribose deacetylase (regulator of RNase III)